MNPITKLELPRPTEVFEAKNNEGKPVIVKVLREKGPTHFRLFQREAAILRQIRHPAIPRVSASDLFKVNLPDGIELYAFAMEKIEGRPLKSFINSQQNISSAKAVEWLKQLAEILQYLHGEKLFHRDIKPSNIVLRPNGTLALIDFGGVRSSSTETYLAKVSTGDITQLGSNGYTPNEQWHGRALPQSDIYALGWTMISLLAGREPFDIPVEQHSGKAQWRNFAKNLDRDLANLLDRMVAFAPGERPKNTDELLSLIEGIGDRKRWPRPKAWMFPVTVLLGLITLGGHSLLREFRADLHYAQAVQEMDQGDLKEAKAELQQSIKLSPSFNAYQRLAYVCSESNDNQCSLETYKHAITQYPERWELYFDLAGLYDELQSENEAEHYYKKAIAASPSRAVKAYNNLARLKIQQKEFGAAKQLLNTALSQPADKSTIASLKKNLGWALFELKDFSAAEKELLHSLSLDNGNAAPYCLRAQALEKLGQEAKSQWRNCTNLFSDLPEVKTWQREYIKRLQSN